MSRARIAVVAAASLAVTVHLLALTVGGVAGLRVLGAAGAVAVVAAIVAAHVFAYRGLAARNSRTRQSISRPGDGSGAAVGPEPHSPEG